MKIIFATHNKGKVMEMRELLDGLGVEVFCLEEIGVTDDVVEDGDTLADNALKKARFAAERSGEWSLADDTGLCIDALDGRPGVHTARWAGEGASGDELIGFTLEKMNSIPFENRGAYFETVLALVAPDGRHWFFSGRVSGKITLEPRGSAKPKLPYDVIFIPEGEERTFAEMAAEEKNAISHRGRAFEELKEFLKQLTINN